MDQQDEDLKLISPCFVLDYSDTKIVRILNSELADTFGNLLSRVCAKTLNPQEKYAQVHNTQLSELIKLDSCKILIEKVSEAPGKCREHFDSFNFHLVVDTVMAMLHSANGFFEATKPWELKKGDEDALKKLETIISLTMESLRIAGIILQPIIPDFTEKLLQRLNVPAHLRLWKDTKLNLRKISHNLNDLESNILFRRIILESEKPEKLTNKKQRV